MKSLYSATINIPIPVMTIKLFGTPVYYRHLFDDGDTQLSNIFDLFCDNSDDNDIAKMYKFVTTNTFSSESDYTDMYMVGYYVGINISTVSVDTFENEELVTYFKQSVVDACFKYAVHGCVPFISRMNIPVFSAYDVANYIQYIRLISESMYSTEALDSISARC